MKNKKTLIFSIVAILVLVCITVGVSLAFFNYAGAGTTDNTIETGSITFLYTETSSVGRGIAIEDAFPISNSEGKLLTGEGNVFDFNISSETTSNTNIPFEITARKNNNSTLSEDVVVMYLTKVNGTSEEEVLLDKYSNLTQTEKTNAYTEKVLYSGTVYSESDYDQDYRLRMWITDDGTFESDDMGKTFIVTVNVYSNASVVTDSQISFENNTNIETLAVNNSNLTKVENENYDYETVLDEGTTSTTIEINTENPNATIDIRNITNEFAYTNLIQKTSTTRTLEGLVKGNNYFQITVTSENGKAEDEYVVKVQVGNDKFSEVILNNNTLVTSAPTLTTSSNKTSDSSGLYSSTATNSGNPTYYFRGNVNNNYVSFAGLTWRIVRINEDGTVRLILQDGINNNATYKFNTASNDMYYTNSDTIKPTVDSWYTNNLSNYSDKIATGNYFCEQAKVKYGSSYTSGSATMPVYTDYTPNFKCSTDGNGKGIVNSNIGLITYDEMVYAGGYYTNSNSAYYLNNGTNYWSMSPAGVYLGTADAYAWYLINSGRVDGICVYYTYAVRPVINLNANVVVTGTGTSSDPYVVQ